MGNEVGLAAGPDRLPCVLEGTIKGGLRPPGESAQSEAAGAGLSHMPVEPLHGLPEPQSISDCKSVDRKLELPSSLYVALLETRRPGGLVVDDAEVSIVGAVYTIYEATEAELIFALSYDQRIVFSKGKLIGQGLERRARQLRQRA